MHRRDICSQNTKKVVQTFDDGKNQLIAPSASEPLQIYLREGPNYSVLGNDIKTNFSTK